MMHKRSKLEIVIDAQSIEEIREILQRHGVPGFTVLRGISGRGEHGTWHEDRLIGAEQNLLVVTVTSTEKAEQILEELRVLFEERSGIAYVQEVSVIRPGKFP